MSDNERIELLLDNAACASQERRLLEGELRGDVRRNVAEPLMQDIERLTYERDVWRDKVRHLSSAYANEVAKLKMENDRLLDGNTSMLSRNIDLSNQLEERDRQLAALAAEVERLRGDLHTVTETLEEHPEGYDGECLCKLCMSYGDS